MVVTAAAIMKWHGLVSDLNLDVDNTHLRLAIKGGGCSGFMKELDYCEAEDITDKDIVEEHGAVKVVVDMKSMLFLADAVIDYKDGLMDAGFTINIPSAKNSCGCGDSFAM